MKKVQTQGMLDQFHVFLDFPASYGLWENLASTDWDVGTLCEKRAWLWFICNCALAASYCWIWSIINIFINFERGSWRGGFHSFFLKLISEVCQINKNALDIKAKYIISIIWGQGQVVNTPLRILIYFIVGFGSLHRKWKKISWCYLRPWYRAVMNPEKMCYVCSSNPGGMGVGRGDRRSSWEYIRGPCQFGWTMSIFRVCSCRHISSEWEVGDWPFTRLSLLIEKQKDPEKSQFGKGKTIFAGQTQLHVGLYWFFAPIIRPWPGPLGHQDWPTVTCIF